MIILKILFRNAFRHKLRTALTVLGVAIAILAFELLRTVITTWYLGIEASSAYRLVTRNAVSLAFPLPLSYKEKIRQVHGVTTVSYGNWFGGIYKDPKNFFANFAVEPKSFLELYPELVLDESSRAAFVRDRKGFVAGRKLAAKYGWKLGDTVTLMGTIYTGNWDFVLRAIYTGRDRYTDETQFFFHWDYLNEAVKKLMPNRADQVGYYMIGVSSPDIAAQVAVEIDEMFRNSLAETLTETEKAFQQGFLSMSQAIVVIIQLVSLIIIVVIMVVVANTMAMTTRERIGEYAVLKTLGFGGIHIAVLILGESLVITLMGCALGSVLLFPAARVFAKTLETYFPVFHVEPATIGLGIAAGFVVAVVSAVQPIFSAIHIRIADGLRRIG
jgi:putative ABC transport system permease protein